MLGFESISHGTISFIPQPEAFLTVTGIGTGESFGSLKVSFLIAVPSIPSGETFGLLDFSLLDLTIFEVFYTPRPRGTVWIIPQEDD